jgi:hypothetical protein
MTHNSNKRGLALKFSWKPPNNTYDEIDETKVSPCILERKHSLLVDSESM